MDFGGIAKGYALDQMAKVVKDKGIDIFLIDGGGDIIAGTSPPQKEGWDIELPSGKSISVIKKAIATSGDTYKYLLHKVKSTAILLTPGRVMALKIETLLP